MKCTIHTSKDLVATQTRYGKRWGCPVGGCTVVLWDGSTSTPADYGTRQARIVAHECFDLIWKSGMMSRSEAYTFLAKFMGRQDKDVHIGYFDKEQCSKVIQFSEGLRT